MNLLDNKKLKKPIFILDDNKLLLEDLCGALKEQLHDETQVQELTEKVDVPKHAHVIFDVGMGESKLVKVLKKHSPINIWLISGRNLSYIEKFRKKFDEKHPDYHKCLRRAIFQKPLDEVRLLAEIQEREIKKLNYSEIKDTKEIQVFMGLQRPARLIDTKGRVQRVNHLWAEGTSYYRPVLPTNFAKWLKYLRKQPGGFLKEKQWQSDDEAETDFTKGYFEVHSYAMKDSLHVVQFIVPNDHITSWQPRFSERDLIELCKPVMEVLVNRLFTRARLYRVVRYPERGLYKKALYSNGETLQDFHGMRRGCNALHKRLVEYDTSSDIDDNDLKKKIVKVEETDDYWDVIIGMDGVPNWLEIPVLVPSKHHNLKTVALIIFDRKPDGRIWDYKETIKDSEIKSTEKLLLDAVIQIGRLFQVREKQEYYEIRENISAWLHSTKAEQRADELARNIFKLLIKNKKLRTDDAALIRLRGIDAETLETKRSIDNNESLSSPVTYNNLTPISRFKRTRCLYPNDSVPEGLEGNLEYWNKDDYRMLIPTRSGGKVWYIFCFSRKAYDDIQGDCTNCWYRHEKNLAQDLIIELGDYLSEEYAVKLAAKSVERIFIHEAITLFSSMRNLFPKEYQNNDQFRPLQRGIKRLQYFLDNMRLVNKLSKKNEDKKIPKEIIKMSVCDVVESVKDSTLFRQLNIAGLNAIKYLDLNADKFLFELVIYNLLNNAARYATRNSNIIVSSNFDDTYWRFIVCNKLQQLLPKKQIETLFDEYSSYPQSKRSKGIGLGLANSRSTAIEFGGDLKVRQDTQDETITFELIWPIYKD